MKSKKEKRGQSIFAHIVLILLSFLDWANKAGKLKMKYTKAEDMDGRNWVIL